ncbi:LuxR C-terminal-related transcriptional regulator [Streptomyces spiramenti]|uniref:Response regulator transcription factor n=1 Tax=Streptomyces spiramenti TaxID=2720606 RepID=A0ABX1APQ1_9ACTN|nr:response regulator transcription factor [Streptomyces spiramenti]
MRPAGDQRRPAPGPVGGPLPGNDDRPLAVTPLVATEVLRRGLASLLEQIPRVTVVEPGHDALARREPPPGAVEVVIASLAEWRRLPDGGSCGDRPQPVVVLIGDDVRARDLSFPTAPPCDGVLSLTEASLPVLDDTLRRAVRGEFPLPARLARELVAGGRGPGRRREGRPVSFTERETETLGLLIEGYSNKQIAKALGISAHGVKRLVGAILLKLDAPNRTTAAVMAMDQRLV